MKKLKLCISVIIIACCLSACNNDFLQRDPSTSLTEGLFFKTAADLELYTNGLYSQLEYQYADLNSDNISCYTGDGEVDRLVRGGVSADNIGGWYWGDLRKINFMLARVSDISGDQDNVRNYIGIARFFRAWFYIDKIKTYGDVPWYSKDLQTNDDELLYKARDPRTLVVDSIMQDLEYAVNNIKPANSKTRLSKWSALALMSRFCLYEGTFRKYHTELGLKDGDRFLEKCVWASQQIMNSGNFSIYNTGKEGLDYHTLFTSGDLSTNPEIIQFADYDQSLAKSNSVHTVLDWEWGLSRGLADSYLMKDGTPFTSIPGNDKKTFMEAWVNRDPRMRETICYPGFKSLNATKPYCPKLTVGGYSQIKFFNTDTKYSPSWGLNYTDLPIFRFAEVLLNYAEAKAEMGNLTQADIDLSIKPIRDRVSMPNLSMESANSNPDPALVNYYPNVVGANSGVILEIRRERRIELACEGFRYDDLMRWKMGKVFEDGQQGIYIPALGAFDVTGDGVPDVAVLEAFGKTGPIDGLSQDVKDNLNFFYLKDSEGNEQSIYLSEGDHGHVLFTRDKLTQRVFVEPKYYYRPIPQEQIVLNKNLKQMFGW